MRKKTFIFFMLILLTSTASAYVLNDIPDLFISSKGINAAVIVGDSAPSTDISAANEIISSLQKAGTADVKTVNIYVYLDFECPYCKLTYYLLEDIKKDFGAKVNIVYRHMPSEAHIEAYDAAEASECARDQGKFEAMQEKLFENSDRLSVTNLKQYARELGLDTSKFNSCLDNDQKYPVVKSQFNEGEDKGVKLTPTSFINGEIKPGYMNYDKYKLEIEKSMDNGAEVKKVTKITNMNQNMILIGRSSDMTSQPNKLIDKYNDIAYGNWKESGLLALKKQDGYWKLIVTGYSAENVRIAAKVAANIMDFKLNCNNAVVKGSYLKPSASCLTIKEYYCSDSDGDDTFTKGSVSYNTATYGEGKYTDFCNGSTLYEGVCTVKNSKPEFSKKEQDCAGGCNEGRCVPIETKNAADATDASGNTEAHTDKNTKDAVTTELKKMKMGLNKGWNLVSLTGELYEFRENDCGNYKKPAGLVYIKEEERYVTIKEAKKILSGNFENYMAKNAFWIYSYEECDLIVSTSKDIGLNEINLNQGWNMVPVTRDMMGKSIKELGCAFRAVFLWDPVSQDWVKGDDIIFGVNHIGTGIMIMSDKECTIGKEMVQ